MLVLLAMRMFVHTCAFRPALRIVAKTLLLKVCFTVSFSGSVVGSPGQAVWWFEHRETQQVVFQW
jgi:hypothetical protein